MSDRSDQEVLALRLGYEGVLLHQLETMEQIPHRRASCFRDENVLADHLVTLVVSMPHKVTVFVRIWCPASIHTLLRDGKGGGLKNVLFPRPHTKPVWIEQVGWSRSRKGSGSTSFRCSWVSSDPLVRRYRYVRHAERASCIAGRGVSCCEQQEEEEGKQEEEEGMAEK